MNPRAADNTLEKRYERYRGILNDLTIMNDIFMRNVLKKKECTEYILQVIMEKPGLKVREQVIQKDYKNLQGRSAVLDCVAVDADGKQYDVEIQQERGGAVPKRARYHSGLMDMNILEPGQSFDELPGTYVIFITNDDALGYGLSIYHIGRTIEETGDTFQDDSHIIYVNSGRQDDTELGRLMHDFHCRAAGEMYSRILAERVRELKETQRGVDAMNKELEQLYNDGEEHGRILGIAEGIATGELKKAKEMALKMDRKGYPIDTIAELLEVGVNMVRQWLSETPSGVG